MSMNSAGRTLLALACVAGASASAQSLANRTDNDAPIPRQTIPLPGTEGAPPACPFTIQGTLGSGSPEWPSVSGVQLGRLNRNGIASTCAVPKSCLIFTAVGDRAFDAYTFTNGTGVTRCVNITLTVITQTACNLQVDAYLDTFDPTSICTGYLADPGLSSGVPPTPVAFSMNVPAGGNLILDVHTTNVGEIGCVYDLTMDNECVPVELQGFSIE